MTNTTLLELKKALKSLSFITSIAIGCIITLLSVLELFISSRSKVIDITQGTQSTIQYNIISSSNSPFGLWVGVEGYSLGSSILFFVFPLLISIPYGWSYCSERQSGYEKNMVLRSGKNTYYVAKYIATFFSGGLAMILPLLFHFLSLCLCVPIVTPLSRDLLNLGIFPHNLFSWQFYTSPFIYITLNIFLSFVICGLLSCLCYSSAIILNNRIAVTLIPLIFLVVLRYIQIYCFTMDSAPDFEINPMFYLNGSHAITDYRIIFIEIIILLLTTLVPIIVRGRRNEIY